MHTGVERAAELDERLAELQASYHARLSDKLGTLASAVDEARDRSEEALANARCLAHRLHGTAGAYGFPQIGEAAGRLEAAVEAFGRGEAAFASVQEALQVTLDSGRDPVPRRVSTVPPPRMPEGRTGARIARVLVVDADRDFLKHIESLGRRRLIDVVTTTSADDAANLAKSFEVDAAIIDMHLGDRHAGLEAARRVRSQEGCASLPLAFLSADTSTETRVAAVHSGATLFLSKPMDIESFNDAVHHLVAPTRRGTPKILLVDDDEDFAAVVIELLADQEIEIVHETDPAAAIDRLGSVQPDLLLLDVVMPGISGFELCSMIRAIPRHHDLPVVFVTGEPSADVRRSCYQVGGDDYLVKPVIKEELVARIKTRVERQRLHREHKDRDSLTGLLQRRPFAQALDARLSEAKRHGKPVSVALFDLDHFKQINDSYGHLAGDRVLATLGRLMERSFRAADLRGRWGGEEFTVALYGEPAATAARIIQRLLDEFRTIHFDTAGRPPFSVTFSVGVASYPADAGSLDALLDVADQRLYQAKAKGRNCVVG